MDRVSDDVVAVLSVCAAIGGAGQALGGITTWIGPDGGAFDVPRHWTDGVPAESDTALFLDAGPLTVHVPLAGLADRIVVRGGQYTFVVGEALGGLSPSAFTPSIAVADEIDTVAAVTMASGVLFGGHAEIGGGFFSSGALRIEPAAALVIDDVLAVGTLGAGELLVRGTVSTGSIRLGFLDIASGSLTIDGGAVDAISTAVIGGFGSGMLTVVDGGSLVVDELTFAQSPLSEAAGTVSGAGSAIFATALRLGNGGEASLVVEEGALVQVGDDLRVGVLPGSFQFPFYPSGFGHLIVDGIGTRVVVGGDLALGIAGIGDLTVGRGGRVEVGGDVSVVVSSLPTGSVVTFVVAAGHAGTFAEPDAPMLDVVGAHGFGATVAFPYELEVALDPDDPPDAGSAFVLVEAATIAPNLPVTLPTLPGLVTTLEQQIVATRRRLVLRIASAFDLTGDGVVGGADLGILLADWGPCPSCPADFNFDGVVDGLDLGILLANWSVAP